MYVSRGTDDRLSGTVRVGGTGDVHDFSGMLELMRVFEDVVPVDPGTGGASSVSHASGAMRMTTSPRPPDDQIP